MPGPSAHAWFALQHLDNHPERDRRRFLRGVQFPDARSLARLPRTATHRFGVTLPEVVGETNDWQAGCLLHNYLDDAWNEFQYAFGLQFGAPEDEDEWLALKIAEDRILAPQLPHRRELADVFDGHPEPEEFHVGLHAQQIAQWDEWMHWLLTQPYDQRVWEGYVERLGYNVAALAPVLARIAEIQSSKSMLERFERLWQQLGYGPGASR